VLKFEWNALRVGNKVLMHDPRDKGMRLLHGVVAIVDTVAGSNDLAIRVAPKGEVSSVLRPRRLTVHLDPRDLADECWRCDDIAKATAKPKPKPRVKAKAKAQPPDVDTA
jgi:hypothetical protein